MKLVTADAARKHERPAAVVRPAQPDDAAAVAGLLFALGYSAPVRQVRERIIDSAASPGTAVFVVEAAHCIAGVLSFHCIPLFHENGFLGRITSFVVAPEHRARGLGRLLITAAEEFAWARNCIRIEVTSGDHRTGAHAFYEHLGYPLDCRRFMKHRENA